MSVDVTATLSANVGESLRNLRHRTRVALFGYYDRGNFGDDLMAVILHRWLTECGYNVIVYGMTDVDGADFQLTRAKTFPELLDGADVVVVGGGGLFCKSFRWPPSVGYQNDLDRILDYCQEARLPVMGVSLGGSGHVSLGKWKNPALRLIRDAVFCTFRNPEDLKLARLCGRPELTWHPDLVWLTSRFVPRIPKQNDRPTLAVNIAGLKYGRHARRLLLDILERQRYADVCYIDTSNSAGSGFASLSPRVPGSTSTRRKFCGLNTDLEFLANVDLVITNRLHAGLAAMSYGHPMVSFFGYGKTRLALRNSGKTENHVSFLNLAPFLWRLAKPERWKQEYTAVSSCAVASICKQAMGHLTELVSALDQVATNK